MNRAYLQRTVFKDFRSKASSFGFRIYDDHGREYCNTLSQKDLKLSDQKFLDKCRECFDEVGNSIFDYALENGMYIDDEWYTFDLKDKNGPRLVLPMRVTIP